jgi:MFS family permease
MRAIIRSSLPREIKDSLQACWKEGVTAQIVMGIFDYYLIPYALFLGATSPQVGFLVASPNFLSAMAQLFAVRAVTAAGSRHRLLVGTTALQAVMLVPLVFLPLYPFPGKMAILIALVSVFRVLGSLMGPAWGSLVSDYLPEGQRGQYMGWRSRIVSFAGIGGLAFWGVVLLVTKKHSENLGFILLFAAAAVFRFLSLHYMSRMVDVPVVHAPARGISPRTILRQLRQNNLVKFVCYVSGVTFATQLAAPYFSIYMLRDLGFDYLSYTCVHLASVVAGLVAFPVWGRHADHVGTAKIMKSVSWLIPAIPVLWLFARTPLSLAVVEMFSGLIWSGFNLASANFIYDAASPANRVRWLAYHNLINGAAIFLGASIGGWLAPRLPRLLGSRLLSLFLISAVLRLAVHFILSRRFEETRSTHRRVSSTRLFMSVLGLRPLAGENTEPSVYPPLRSPRGDAHPAASP